MPRPRNVAPLIRRDVSPSPHTHSTPSTIVTEPSSAGDSVPSPPNKPQRSWLVLLLRSVWLTVGVLIGGAGGIAIAIWQPEWVGQLPFRNKAASSAQFTLSADALFLPNTATLRPESLRLLDEVAARLPNQTGKTIRTMGFADASDRAKDGERELITLPYQRAIVVRDYLKRLRGENTYYWVAVSFGASRPIAIGDAQANRRIEIVIGE